MQAGYMWLQAQELLAEVLKGHVEAAVAAGASAPTEQLEQWCVAFRERGGGGRVELRSRARVRVRGEVTRRASAGAMQCTV